jgi:hypothetical protein
LYTSSFLFVCCIPLSIFCNASLVVMICFSLCLSWKVFISPSILKDKFGGHRGLG